MDPSLLDEGVLPTDDIYKINAHLTEEMRVKEPLLVDRGDVLVCDLASGGVDDGVVGPVEGP